MLFLSYSREDNSAASQLESELLRGGFYLHRDQPLLTSNAFWRDQTYQKLINSEVLVILWSRHASASPWVDQEIRAYSGSVLVILLDETPWHYQISPHKPCLRVNKSDAIQVLCDLLRCEPARDLLPNEASSCTLKNNDFSKLRQEKLYQARTDYRNVFTRVQRKPWLAPLSGNGLVINEWDATVLKRVLVDEHRTLYVATEPVTNRQYQVFMMACGFPPPPTWVREEFAIPEKPVVGINWFEARAYALWVGGDLPTEKLWMQAAAGRTELTFATATGEILPELAYYYRPFTASSPVVAKQFPASPDGLYGMCGNTWDWCCSSHKGQYIIKGGGYMDSAFFCAVQARYRQSPLDGDCVVGFRIKIKSDAKCG